MRSAELRECSERGASTPRALLVMGLLDLPEELLVEVLRDWLSAACAEGLASSDWKALAALDVAACGGKPRAQLLHVFRKISVVVCTARKLNIGDEYFIDRLRQRTAFVAWIQTRAVACPLLRLSSTDIQDLVTDHQYPEFSFLHGIVWEIGSFHASVYKLEDEVAFRALFPRLLAKIPRLTRFGIVNNGTLRRPLFILAALAAVVEHRGSHLVGLSITQCAVDDDLLATLLESPYSSIEELTLDLGPGASFKEVTRLLHHRGNTLRSCRIVGSRLNTDAAQLRRALRSLTHPGLRVFTLQTSFPDLDQYGPDLFLEFLAAQPQLQSCAVGQHSFFIKTLGRADPSWERGGAITLAHMDGRGGETTVLPAAGNAWSSVHVCTMELPLWDEPAPRLGAHERSMAELRLTYDVPAHGEAYPARRLREQLPALRRQWVAAAAARGSAMKPPKEQVTGGLLKCLRLLSLPHLTDSVMEHMLRGLPFIDSIELWNCPSLTDSGLMAIAATCPHMRSLWVSGAPQLTPRGLHGVQSSAPSCRVRIPEHSQRLPATTYTFLALLLLGIAIVLLTDVFIF